MMQLILQCLKRFLRSMYFRKKEPSALQREDRKRMPEGYMEKADETVKKKGGSLELTETVPDGMDGGFILTYGGIE